MVEWKAQRSIVYGLAMLSALFLSVLAAGWPELLAARFVPPQEIGYQPWVESTTIVARALSVPFLALAILFYVYWRNLHRTHPAIFLGLVLACALCSYWSLAQVFSDWIIDDAGITFAYSENLALGNGLRLFPSHIPEEGYSNTLWMLILAFSKWLGFEIPIAAKSLNLLFGSLCIAGAILLARRELGVERFGLLVPLLLGTLLQAPFLIWSISGLEHGLQALLFALILYFAGNRVERRVAIAICLGLLILVRPETPLIVVLVWGTFALSDFLEERERWLIHAWPVAVIPFVIFIALLGFRLAYFGDLFPNPFYAKAGGATVLRLFNLVGGGWEYILSWLGKLGMFLLIPFLLLLPIRKSGMMLRVAGAIVCGQVFFIVWAAGDWMGCWRFIAPIVPVLGVILSASPFFQEEEQDRYARVLLASWICFGLISIQSVKSLAAFRVQPTTPIAVVTAVGEHFARLAELLDIDSPTLAHHDAGGTSYRSVIDMVDLGGLGSRVIAQHMNDRAFLTKYLFVEKKPTFIFGSAHTFAAGLSRFYEDPRFKAMYVPVSFLDAPVMRSEISEIRRDLVKERPGVRVLRAPDGSVARVLVEPAP